MTYQIIALPKAEWKGFCLPIGYTTEEYYDIVIEQEADGFHILLPRRRLDTPVTHDQMECDYADKLYADWWEDAYAWGILKNGKLIAAIETAPEEWSNRLRITELWVDPAYQKMGLGKALMNVAKEQMRHERRRALMLETQSCNVNAIGFYLHEGFRMIGLDTCCYSNSDVDRHSVRLEMGYLKPIQEKLSRAVIEMRPVEEVDCRECEILAQRAFWNKYHPGCNEHLLVQKLSASKDCLPAFSRIALLDGRVIGGIWYAKAEVIEENNSHEVVTFGPLCVMPEWQGRGVGELLLKETLPLAAKAGYPGVVIYGEADYYPRFGFKTCDHFGITSPDGQNFDALMAYALTDEMRNVHGKFFEPKVYSDLSDEETDKLTSSLPPLPKLQFPKQWK